MIDDVSWPWKVKVVTLISLGPNISKTALDKELVTMEHPKEMLNGVSNGHMPDDLTWPQKVKVVTQINLKPDITKTLGD